MNKNYRYRKDLRARGEDAVCDIAAVAKGSRRRPPRMGVDEQYTHMYTGGRLDRSRPTHLVCSQWLQDSLEEVSFGFYLKIRKRTIES